MSKKITKDENQIRSFCNSSKCCIDKKVVHAVKEFLKTHENSKKLTKQQEITFIIELIKFFRTQIFTINKPINLTNTFNGVYNTIIFVNHNNPLSISSVGAAVATLVPQSTIPFLFSSTSAFDVNSGSLLTSTTFPENEIPNTSALAIPGPSATFELNVTLSYTVTTNVPVSDLSFSFDVRMYLLQGNDNVYKYTVVGDTQQITVSDFVSQPINIHFQTVPISLQNLGSVCYAVLVISNSLNVYNGVYPSVVSFGGQIQNGSVLPLLS